MTDPQPSCSEIAMMCFVASDNEGTLRNIIKALEAKQKTIEELTAKLVAEQDMTSKLSDDLLEREVRLHAYESYRIFKQDTFRAVDGGAPVMEIDAVKAFEVIDRLRTALEKIRETKYATVIRHIAREALQ